MTPLDTPRGYLPQRCPKIGHLRSDSSTRRVNEGPYRHLTADRHRQVIGSKSPESETSTMAQMGSRIGVPNGYLGRIRDPQNDPF